MDRVSYYIDIACVALAFRSYPAVDKTLICHGDAIAGANDYLTCIACTLGGGSESSLIHQRKPSCRDVNPT